MTPHSILRDLCDRYGLSPAHGERLLPLIERALKAPPGVRERILELVEGNLEQESKRLAAHQMDPTEERLLRVVAKTIHRWNPPSWLLKWCDGGPPPGPNPLDLSPDELAHEDDDEDEGRDELERDAG